MSQCPKIEKCPLFPRFTLQSNLEFWKRHYCHASFEKCERYKLSQAGERPRDTMLPDGNDIVVTIKKPKPAGD